MAKAIKKVKEAAAKLAKLRKKPGMSNAGKYPNVKESNFCGPNGTYPVNTVKRARSALSLAHFSADPGDIRKCVHKKYPQLADNEKKEAKKKSPVAYGSSPLPFNGDKDSISIKQEYDKLNALSRNQGEFDKKELEGRIKTVDSLKKKAVNHPKLESKLNTLLAVLQDASRNN